MKLVRYGAEGAEKPGMLDATGHVRDLSGLIDDVGGMRFCPTASHAWLGSIRQACRLLRGRHKRTCALVPVSVELESSSVSV